MSVPSPRSGFAGAFPSSTKVYVTGACAGERVAVPMREIALSGGEPPLRVYDTSGPPDCDVRQGLPSVRGGWIARRGQVVEVPARRPLRFLPPCAEPCCAEPGR